MTLVETSAWVDFLRRGGDARTKQEVARLLESGTAAYTCPTIVELLAGARTESEVDLVEETLDLACRVRFEADYWMKAGRLEARLRGAGTPVPRDDILVATVAVERRLVLLCRDRHFDAIRDCVGDSLRLRQMSAAG